MISVAETLPVASEEDLHLRLVQRDSVAAMTDFMTDNINVAYLAEFQPWAVTMNPQGVARAVAARIADIAKGNSLQYQVIHNGVMAGAVTLYDHEGEQARAGYYIGANFAGRGYATRATEALVEYAAQPDVWGMRYFQLCIDDQNEPSKAVARKLGATPTNHFSSEETIVPTVYRPLRIWEKHL